LHGKGQTQLIVLTGVIFEQLVIADKAIESGPGDFFFAQQALFDTSAINVGFVVARLGTEKRQDLVNGFEELLGGDFTGFAL
jgi:hypothetical protein